jgi:hypothetical protein
MFEQPESFLIGMYQAKQATQHPICKMFCTGVIRRVSDPESPMA